MIEIRRLRKEDFNIFQFEASYTTSQYYDVTLNKDDKLSFIFELKDFKQYLMKRSTFTFFQDHLEKPKCYGAFIDDELVGLAEGSIESWNNRFRITNLLVFDKYRKQGVAKKLMEALIESAYKQKCRMIVLETQTCNIDAIGLYQSFGFEIIGVDLYCYSNEDVNNHEVRIEMGKFLD